MVDITKIQLNPIPPPLVVLQNENTKLQGTNNTLRNILIVGGVLVLLYLGDKIITYIKEENERKNKSKFPRV
jgi:hypothetical protein